MGRGLRFRVEEFLHIGGRDALEITGPLPGINYSGYVGIE